MHLLGCFLLSEGHTEGHAEGHATRRRRDERETNDFFTGHSQGDEAGKHGSGPMLETKYRAVHLVEHPSLTPVLGTASNCFS